MTKIFNKTEFKKRRQDLRNNPTKAETLLWNILKGKRLGGYKFRRQFGVEKYIIDFYCAQKKLAVEADGEVHDFEYSRRHDKKRDECIFKYGIKILRFRNEEVERNIEEVAEKILKRLEELPGRSAWI